MNRGLLLVYEVKVSMIFDLLPNRSRRKLRILMALELSFLFDFLILFTIMLTFLILNSTFCWEYLVIFAKWHEHLSSLIKLSWWLNDPVFIQFEKFKSVESYSRIISILVIPFSYNLAICNFNYELNDLLSLVKIKSPIHIV